MEEQSYKKRARDDSDESELGLPEVKRLKDDLLSNLDDSDLDTTSPDDLDSFMKSFEEEILASPPPPATLVYLTSDSGESRPDLGYLLEASDDELGLPPSTTTTSSSELENSEETELVRVSSDSTGFSELWGFDDQIPSYDSLGFGIGDTDSFNYTNGEITKKRRIKGCVKLFD
ncbi:hypothetical protein F0562_032746 [Nyssa sinensis]|uniref:Uncharacterized protein n=1 Tax=Nyssa sinensis TaxID=561372 RepID=A0A5J5ANX1_9ASTE|nr:hypothetical protein F0562_032746 [Nyssa sinensis]